MEWIPYQRLTISTELSKEEVLERMRVKVGPKRRHKFIRVDENIFAGRFTEDTFDFRLHKDYKNSWTPQIFGTIREINGKTELSVTLKSDWAAISFTALFMVVGLAMFTLEILYFKGLDDFDLMGVGFIVVSYGLTWFGFNLDADKAIDKLIEITKGEIK